MGRRGTLFGEVHPFQISYLYNNTDFPVNPSTGSSQWFSYSYDAFSDTKTGDWTFVEFEASKYFDLGPSSSSRQRVIALNLWTGVSPSWSTKTDEDGTESVVNKPPFFEGAHLGGFYRMRGYPNNRFNDRAVIYTAGEYRHTLKWNPIKDVSWLKWLKSDCFSWSPLPRVAELREITTFQNSQRTGKLMVEQESALCWQALSYGLMLLIQMKEPQLGLCLAIPSNPNIS